MKTRTHHLQNRVAQVSKPAVSPTSESAPRGRFEHPAENGAIKLSGDSNAFYERHVTFDQIVPEKQTSARDKFEAIARSVRDMLSQRWLNTEQTYQQRNVKRVYYLSMEFLLGRALANNIANLRMDPEAQEFAQHHQLNPLHVIEEEPDAGLGNGGLGRLAACFLDSMATLGIQLVMLRELMRLWIEL